MFYTKYFLVEYFTPLEHIYHEFLQFYHYSKALFLPLII